MGKYQFPLPAEFDFGSLSTADLDELETEARQAAAPIVQVDASDLTEEQVTLLESLGATVASVATAREALAVREAALAAEAAQRAERVAALAASLAPVGAPAGTPDPAPTAPDPAPTGVTASTPPAAPRIGQIAQTVVTTPVQQPRTLGRRRVELPDGMNFADFVMNPEGTKDYGDWREVAKEAERRLKGYQGMRGQQHNTVFALQRKFEQELLQGGQGDDDALVSYAVDPGRLPSGGLTAAAGWCAPSQVIYDLCELETSDGMVDLPEVQITRGGMRFTPGPDFATIFGGAGYFHQTEAQVIAGTTKPCMDIPCPNFTDIRLEVEGVCITGSILQRRGYPELVERFIRGAMVAHMHKLNAFVIAQMVAGSTVVDLNPPVDVPLDVSVASNLLMTVEQQIEDIRYRNRLGFNAEVELVFPHWIRPLFRADLSRRQGLAEFEVSDDRIDAWIRMRGGRPQYVYDWQDAFSGQATGPGGASPLTLWPNSVFYLAYPAGTWLRGSDDTIRLETIYDSAKLATNQYTALFTEEGVLVAQVCNGGSRVVEVQICPNGVTAAPVAYVCA